MIINSQESYMKKHTDISDDIKYSHYYISGVSIRSSSKKRYLNYVNLLELSYSYSIYCIEYWTKKDAE